MDGILKDFLSSGRALLRDTKLKKPTSESVKAPKKGLETPPVTEQNPHKVLQRRAIHEKIKKKDLVEEFKKIIQAEEAKL